MKSLYKGMAIAVITAVACGVTTAPKASADVVIQTTSTYPGVIDYSMSDPIVLTQPAVIDTSPVVAPTIMTSPTVIDTTPVYRSRWNDDHLLHLGLPFLDFNLL